MEDLIVLRKFHTLEEASGIVEILEKNKIYYRLEKSNAANDVVFAGNTLDTELHLKIKPEDMESTEKILEEVTEVNIEKLDKDYYLFSFQDDELMDILRKPDEWSMNDYLWAQEILKQRGKEVDQSRLDEWKKNRLEFLARPDQVKGNYIFNSYLFCVLGGFIGFFMGRHLKKFRKLLPNGQKVFAFDEPTRLTGQKIERTGIIFMLLYLVLLFYWIFS